MMKEFEEKAKFKLEYLSICDAQTLQEVTTVRKKTLIALAAWVGKTRLIDNILLRGE
jgi:pantothenate synthetase